MDIIQDIKRQLAPLVKGFPIIFACFVLALFLANKMVDYTPRMYQTIAKIKLDDQLYSFSANNLYADFDVFSAQNKTASEAELLKSPLIIQKALDSIDLTLQLFRKGRMKNTLLYNDSPISITYNFKEPYLYNQFYDLSISESGQYVISYELQNEHIYLEGQLDSTLYLEGGWIKLSKKQRLSSRQFQLHGNYLFKVFSKDQLTSDIKSRLDVKSIDKEMSILRVVYKEENPEKAQHFVQILCNTYVQDCIHTKSIAASQTLQFIDKKLKEVRSKLKIAADNLEAFKIDNSVVNTRQETETGLREISKLNIQLVNLEMNEKAIIQLESYMETGDYFDETAINFGFGDLLMTELVKKLKLWQDERQELLIIYTPSHEKVQAMNAKIEDVKVYVKEAIRQNLKEIKIKRTDIESAVEKASHMFDELPSREKNQHILEREFQLQEKVYKFLSQKKIEASIAASAKLSFHRIIQPPALPTDPTSPNQTLIVFVAGFLGLIIGISIVYLKELWQAKIIDKDDIERVSNLDVAGVIRHNNETQDFDILAKSLLIKKLIRPKQIIAISSGRNGEGKSHVSKNLAEAFTRLGYKTCLTDIFVIQQSDFLHQSGQSENRELMHTKFKADFVIIDTPSTIHSIEGVEAMKLANLSLYLVRSNYTSKKYLAQPELLKEEFQLENIQLLLNDAPAATNYNGNYKGASYKATMQTRGVWRRIIKSYRNLTNK